MALAQRSTVRVLPPAYQRAALEPLLESFHFLHAALLRVLAAVPERLAPAHAYLAASTAAHVCHALRAVEEALRGDEEERERGAGGRPLRSDSNGDLRGAAAVVTADTGLQVRVAPPPFALRCSSRFGASRINELRISASSSVTRIQHRVE